MGQMQRNGKKHDFLESNIILIQNFYDRMLSSDII